MNEPPGEIPPVLNPAYAPGKTLRRLFLTLFLRGRSSRGLRKETAPKSVGQKLAVTLFFYALFGSFALFLHSQSVFALSVYLHGMTFVFLGMFVASSAGEVLFNKEEADILLHRPVSARELLWAKIGVLVQVSLWLAGAFNIAGLLLGTFGPTGNWMFPLAHTISVTLEALFCTSLVVMVYQLCLRWFGRERLDGLMTMAQIVLSITLVVGAQIVPRVIGRVGGGINFNTDSWWVMVLPPAWFAGMDDALAGQGGSGSWLLAGVGLIATGIVLWLAFGKLAGDYEAGLQKLGETTSRRPKNRVRRRWLDVIVNSPPLSWWLRDSVSRASFLLTAAYLVRDRDVKLRVYPGLAPMLVLPFIFLLQPGDASTKQFGLAFAGGYLGLVPLLGLNMLKYSQHWQAADIFHVTPMAGPAALCHGARRAALLFLALPVLLFFLLLSWFMRNQDAHIVLMLPGLVATPIYSLIPCLGGKAVPFSLPTEEAKSAGRGMNMIGVMVVSMALSVLTTIAWSQGWFWWLVLGESLVVIALYLGMRKMVEAARWQSLE